MKLPLLASSSLAIDSFAHATRSLWYIVPLCTPCTPTSDQRAAAAKILHEETLWLAIDYGVTLCMSRSACMHKYDKSSHLLCPPSTTLPAPDQRAADEKLLYLASSQLIVDSQSVTPRFQQFITPPRHIQHTDSSNIEAACR